MSDDHANSLIRLFHRNLVLDLPLIRKNYNDPCSTASVIPLILVLVLLKRNFNVWTCVKEQGLITELGAVGYWISLRGQPPRNEQKIRIHIPRSNIFDAGGLVRITQGVQGG